MFSLFAYKNYANNKQVTSKIENYLDIVRCILAKQVHLHIFALTA